MYLFFFLAIGDTSVAVYRRFFEEGATKIGISAHIGGMLAGNSDYWAIKSLIFIISGHKKLDHQDRLNNLQV